ncbi:MAG: hypothetical protein ACLPY5_05615, partial [Candidatus Bathyarchaeia archaeon]
LLLLLLYLDGKVVLLLRSNQVDIALFSEVLALVAIATMDRSKSIVATQEETLTLSQPQQRIQPVQ